MSGNLLRLLLLCLLLLSGSAAAASVAAAADLKFALSEIAANFERERGGHVVLAFGSSGHFARQIPQGAPYELFLSADEEYIFQLARQRLLRDEGRLYAIGRLALLLPRGSSVAADGELRGLASALAAGKLQQIGRASCRERV